MVGRSEVELLESAIEAPVEDEKVLQVHEALESLEAEDPEKARIVKLRFFVGLKNEEIASLLGVNEKTVRRHWEVAKVKLVRKDQGGGIEMSVFSGEKRIEGENTMNQQS